MDGGHKKRRDQVILGICLIIVGTAFIIVGAVAYGYKKKEAFKKTGDRVGVVVDAGGSGTRLIVYSYNKKDDFSQLKYFDCEKKGLAKYEEDEFPTLKALLTKCLNNGAKALPEGKKVPVYFAATAGMRLLKLSNAKVYNEIWSIVKECLDASQFKTMRSDTISGFEEATWSWIAANYLKKTLKTPNTIGMVEVGSSSTQLTFEVNNNVTKSNDVKTLVIDGKKKTVYGHSYLCYGTMEMERRFIAKLVKEANYASVVENPCNGGGFDRNMTSDYLWANPCSSGAYARDYLGEDITGPANQTFLIKGSSNFSQCYAAVKDLLDRKCNKSSCGMNGEFQPEIGKLNMDFFALGSTLYYLGKYLKLSSTPSKSQFHSSTKTACDKPYKDQGSGKYVYLRCFQGAYGYYMMNNGFGFPDNWKLEFVKKIDNKKVGWNLGLIYMNKDHMYRQLRSYIKTITRPGFIALIAVGGVFLIGGVVLLIVKLRRDCSYEAVE